MLMLVIFPEICMEGTKEGLILWYNGIVPTLLPYMMLTNILINTDIFKNLKTSERFFSMNSLLSIFIGFFCGYPMGAYFVANNVKAGYIKKSLAYWLLSFVNLCSPAFIIQFIVIQNLKGKHLPEIIISVYVSAVITALIFLPIYYSKFNTEKYCQTNSVISSKKKDVSECITDSFMQVIKLCGYIVLFSVTLKMVTANINTVTIRHIILIGLLEITNGINTASQLINDENLKVSLITLFTSFGSLSCVFQTYAVIKGSGLKLTPYVISKIIQASISLIIVNLLMN